MSTTKQRILLCWQNFTDEAPFFLFWLSTALNGEREFQATYWNTVPESTEISYLNSRNTRAAIAWRRYKALSTMLVMLVRLHTTLSDKTSAVLFTVILVCELWDYSSYALVFILYLKLYSPLQLSCYLGYCLAHVSIISVYLQQLEYN